MELKTLEDLRKYLELKYNNEWKNDRNDNFEEVFSKSYKVLESYDLTEEEQEYVLPIHMAMEAQTHIKTMINTSKAKAILLKRKEANKDD